MLTSILGQRLDRNWKPTGERREGQRLWVAGHSGTNKDRLTNSSVSSVLNNAGIIAFLVVRGYPAKVRLKTDASPTLLAG